MLMLQRIVLATGILTLLLATPCFGAAEKASDRPRVEVAFVLDTTGSMSSLIDGAKKKIWSIANTIVDQNPNADIYMGLVGYRDKGDDYVTKHFPLTTDIQSIYAELLTFKANGGGDTPESVNEALDVAVTKLGWTDSGQTTGKTRRIIFLVGDAPPHMDYTQDRKYPTVIKEAVSKGIIVNTVQAGDMQSTKKFWREMAKLGNGDYLSIPQDGGRVIIIETPYDERIRILQIEINKTVIPYGSIRQQSQVREKSMMYEAAPSASAADMSSYVSKTGKGARVITGSGDLVQDVLEGEKKPENIAKEELPEALRSKSPEELRQYVAEQSGKRKTLSDELKDLVTQRDRYIQEQSAKENAKQPADSFDKSVKDTLLKQLQ